MFQNAQTAKNPPPGFAHVRQLITQEPTGPTGTLDHTMMNSTDPDIADVVWNAAIDFFVPADNWSSETGLVHALMTSSTAMASQYLEKSKELTELVDLLKGMKKTGTLNSSVAKSARLAAQRLKSLKPADLQRIMDILAKSGPESAIDALNLTSGERSAMSKLITELGKQSQRDSEIARLASKSSWGKFLKVLSTSVTDALPGAAADARYLRFGEAVPVVGIALTAGGTAYDIMHSNTDPVVAVTANVGSLAVGTAGTVAITTVLESEMVASSIGGPAGLVVGAGIAAGTVAGYLAYLALNSDPAKKIITSVENSVSSTFHD